MIGFTRVHCLSSLILAAAAGAAGAQSARIDEASLLNAQKLREQVLAENESYVIVESLTTEVGSRMAGSAADARAVAWAVNQFRDFKFDRVYTEPVSFPRWVRRTERAEIVAPFPHQLAVAALGGTRGTGSRPIEAEVVAYSTIEALESARSEDVRGKIVFIGNRMQRAHDGSGYRDAVKARSMGAAIAAGLGARALLIRSIGTDSDRLPHTGMGVSRGAVLADPLQAAQLKKTRSGIPIVTSAIPAGAISNPDADLMAHLLERGKPITIRLLLDVGFDGEYTSQNVIGEITGSEKPDEVVLIGGHLDSWDAGTGAIDDGAGIAITIAAAQAIKAHGLKPRRTIRVVAFANEEQGGYGGLAYAAAHGTQADKHIIGAEADLGTGRVWELKAKVGADAYGAIDQLMQLVGPLGVARGAGTAEGGTDIAPMVALGVPVASLQQDASSYFNYHHTANDTLDKIDPDALTQATAAFAVFAYLSAQVEGSLGP